MQTLPRWKILELCQDLGHDPARVARIVIEPQGVEVIYFHPVVENAEPLQASADGNYEETKES